MEIHWTNLDGLDEKDRQGAEDKFRKLAASHNDLIDLRITGKKNGHRAHASEEVRIACQARGREIVASRSADQVGRALHQTVLGGVPGRRVDIGEEERKRLRALGYVE